MAESGRSRGEKRLEMRKEKTMVFWTLQVVKALHKCAARWTVSPLLFDLGLQMIHGIHWSTTPACQSVIKESQLLFFASYPCFYFIQLTSQWCICKCERSSTEMQKSSLSVYGSSATLPLCLNVFSCVWFLLPPALLKYISFSLIVLQTQTESKDTLQGRKSSALFALRGHLPWILYSQFIFKLLFIHSK